MDNIIATWICVDTQVNGTHFPSAGGNSSDIKVQNIYWRCICCFFTMARLTNPTARLVLFCNSSSLPIVEGTEIQALLQKLNVAFYITPFEYVTPVGYYNQWRNQFYEFSILKFISNHKDFKNSDRFLLLDSDCIITRDLSSMFNEISNDGCITYVVDYSEDQMINGHSRKDMQAIFSALSNQHLQEIPDYHGGEIFAATIEVVKTLITDFYPLWELLLKLHQAGLPKLNEEAHVLSYLFFKNGFKGGQANKYIKRLWTDPTTHRNIITEDSLLHIWHLPAEKRHGFKELFKWLQKREFDLSSLSSEQVKYRLQNTFMIPKIPLQWKPYFIGKYLYKKYLQRGKALKYA
jgi:hypothetical protein